MQTRIIWSANHVESRLKDLIFIDLLFNSFFAHQASSGGLDLINFIPKGAQQQQQQQQTPG